MRRDDDVTRSGPGRLVCDTGARFPQPSSRLSAASGLRHAGVAGLLPGRARVRSRGLRPGGGRGDR